MPGFRRLRWLAVAFSVLVLAGCTATPQAGTPTRDPHRSTLALAHWDAVRARSGRVVPAGRPLLLGHRGGQERGYQNSMAAFSDAIALGLDYIETDVRHSADGVAVLQHDPELPRACDRYRGKAVRTLTAAELATVRCGGQPIATLAELVHRLQRPDALRVGLMAEVKDVDPLGIRRAVVPLGWSRVIIESFQWGALGKIQKADPQAVTCPLGVSLTTLRRALTVTHDCIGPDKRQATAALVAAAHAAGVGVVVWTVNSASRARTLADRRVDGIITDRPRLLIPLLASPGKTPAGKTPAGKTPSGGTPSGRTPAGRTPAGKTPAGGTPAGASPPSRPASSASSR